jgi:hypothetical protein
MEREAFGLSLKVSTRRIPFHPFLTDLFSGSQLSVDRPETIVSRGGVAVHFDQDGIPTPFDHQGVARMIGMVNVASAS